jgi:hypothetical protein
MKFQAEVGHSIRDFCEGRVMRETPLFTTVEGCGGIMYKHGDSVALATGHCGKIVGIAKDQLNRPVCCLMMYSQDQENMNKVHLRWDDIVTVLGVTILKLVYVTAPGEPVQPGHADGGDTMLSFTCLDAIFKAGLPEEKIVQLSDLPTLLYDLVPPEAHEFLATRGAENLLRFFLVTPLSQTLFERMRVLTTVTYCICNNRCSSMMILPLSR